MKLGEVVLGTRRLCYEWQCISSNKYAACVLKPACFTNGGIPLFTEMAQDCTWSQCAGLGVDDTDVPRDQQRVEDSFFTWRPVPGAGL